MAVIQGKSGEVQWEQFQGTTDAPIDQIINWSLDVTGDVADATGMSIGAGPWPKEYLAGFTSWTASVETVYSDTGLEVPLEIADAAAEVMALGQDENTADVPAELELWFDNDDVGVHHGFYGDAICTGLSAAVDKDDIIKVTYTFQGTGTLVYTAAEHA